jgi:hypothetical protein
MKVIDAYFGTAEDRKNWAKIIEKPKQNDQQALSYLQKNTNEVLFKYREYPKKVLNDCKAKYELQLFQHQDSKYKKLVEYQMQRKKLDEIKSGKDVFCSCGGIAQIVNGHFGEFVSCSNWKNQNLMHDVKQLTYLTDEFQYREFQPFDEWLMNQTPFTKQYISHFRKWAEIPSFVKASVLFEWLVGMEQEIYNKELEREFYQTSASIAKIAKIQEGILKGFLQKKFDKVFDQQLLMVKFEGFDYYQYRLPDFICLNDTDVWVIELKKSFANRNEEQLQEYQDALKVIAQKSNLTKEVKNLTVFYDKEDIFLPPNCTYIQDLNNYEFN